MKVSTTPRGPLPSGTRQTRVLVVENSAPHRDMLIAALSEAPDLQVVGWAANGAEAVRAAARLRPDVITMDVRMPIMDGIEATRRIMAETPTPVVLVSSHARGDGHLAVEALAAGVMAIVPKPPLNANPAHGTDELVRTVRSMAQVKVVRRWSPDRLQAATASGQPAPTPGPVRRSTGVVAIGASTGGPQVLGEILAGLPADFPIPILVVQHIAPGFEAGLVDWLRTQCALPIHLVTSIRPIEAPGVFVAPSGRHLILRGNMLALTHDSPVSGHRPSATVLFRSVAREAGGHAIGVLLTGMGDDGAEGLSELKRAGGLTVAQDQATSVVFGMPAVAIGMGIVDHVLPPVRIADLLTRLSHEVGAR